jgi:hypothetical protein
VKLGSALSDCDIEYATSLLWEFLRSHVAPNSFLCNPKIISLSKSHPFYSAQSAFSLCQPNHSGNNALCIFACGDMVISYPEKIFLRKGRGRKKFPQNFISAQSRSIRKVPL